VIDSRHADAGSADVSEAGVTVAGMSTHVCTWFEDTWPDHACDCGARAVLVMDDDGAVTFAVLDVAPSRTSARELLPISA
jgi:hypothetical protein